jgi:hypothetical protein
MPRASLTWSRGSDLAAQLSVGAISVWRRPRAVLKDKIETFVEQNRAKLSFKPGDLKVEGEVSQAEAA